MAVSESTLKIGAKWPGSDLEVLDLMKYHAVMVVEDDEAIREVVQQVLESEGFEVLTACNGKEAIATLERLEQPCLILLDLMMPEMNGWEFLEHRKQSFFIQQLPVVVVSAVAEKHELPTGIQIVRKPPDIEALLALAHHYCVPSSNVPSAA